MAMLQTDYPCSKALAYPAGAIPIINLATPSDNASGMRLDDTDVQEARYCDWLRAIVCGDQQAFSRLYDATASQTYGLALRITGQPALAEEAVSDCYAQAWRQADRYDPARGKVSTWLLTICRSRALDALRREDSNEDIDDHEVEDPGLGPDALLEYTDASSELHQALLQLDSTQRQLMALAFYRGMSHSELADYTDLPLGTVKTHMRKALAELRSRLSPTMGQAPKKRP
jgi:RNA polymerase sigma factor (sigma-70 family)